MGTGKKLLPTIVLSLIFRMSTPHYIVASSSRHGFRLSMAVGRGDSGNTRPSPFPGKELERKMEVSLIGGQVMLYNGGRTGSSLGMARWSLCSGPGDTNVSIEFMDE